MGVILTTYPSPGMILQVRGFLEFDERVGEISSVRVLASLQELVNHNSTSAGIFLEELGKIRLNKNGPQYITFIIDKHVCIYIIYIYICIVRMYTNIRIDINIFMNTYLTS